MKLVISGTVTLDWQAEEPAKPKLVFEIEYENLKISPATMVTLTVDQKVKAHLQALDSKGNPAKLDGEPEWTTSDSDVATVTSLGETEANKWSADITPAGKAGVCQILAQADANLDPGTTTELTGFLDVTVSAGQAVVFELTADEPEAITPPAK